VRFKLLSTGCAQCPSLDAGLTGWTSRAYRDQVELSMAAAACLRWAKITICDCEAVHSVRIRELLVGAR
jgi:hypothetical protein